MKKNKKTAYGGLQKNIRSLKTPKIELWRNQYSDKHYKVNIKTGEFTCICPKTGLPDFADIEITYIPDKHCIELKSFKLYLYAFRQVGIFHEHVVNRMLEDLVKVSVPKYMRIEGIFNTRGGITTTVEAEYTA